MSTKRINELFVVMFCYDFRDGVIDVLVPAVELVGGGVGYGDDEGNEGVFLRDAGVDVGREGSFDC